MRDPALDALIISCRSSDPDQRHDAISGLLGYAGADVGRAMSAVEEATRDDDDDVAALAIAGLADRNWPGAREAILANLGAANNTRRLAALRAAGVIDVGDQPVAWDALRARDWASRIAAAGALAAAREHRALGAVRDLAVLARHRHRRAAEAHLLGSAMLLGDAESGKRFLSLLAGQSRESRNAAALFLSRGSRLEHADRVLGKEALTSALTVGQRRDHLRRERNPGLPRGSYPALSEKFLERLSGE